MFHEELSGSRLFSYAFGKHAHLSKRFLVNTTASQNPATR